jgi:hypothetical protein
MYRCYAENPLGTDETSCFMHIDGMFKEILFGKMKWGVWLLL